MEQTNGISNGLVYSIIPKVMAKIGHIEKSNKNKEQGYFFRGIDDVYFSLQPLLAEHGLFYTTDVLQRERQERVSKSGGVLTYTIMLIKFTFFASDGSFVCSTTVGEAMDSGDKSSNKAMSTALKYALVQLFCIPTKGDNDTENHSHEIMPKNYSHNHATEKKPAPIVIPNPEPKSGVSDNQRKMLWARLKNELKLSDESARDFLKAVTNKESSKDWVRADFDAVMVAIDKKVKPAKEELPPLLTDEEMWDEDRE